METILIGHSSGLDRVEIGRMARTEQVLDNAPVAQIAVDPGDMRRVYAATLGGGVFRSTDAGRTFAHLDGLDVARCWSVAVSASDVTAGTGALYVGTEMSALFRSVDGGGTFDELTAAHELESVTGDALRPAPRSHHISAIVLDSRNPDAIAFSTETRERQYGLWPTSHLSNDRGATWALLERDPRAAPQQQPRYRFGWLGGFAPTAVRWEGTLVAGAPGIVYRVTDEGDIFRWGDDARSFSKVEYENGPIAGTARALTVIPA